MIDQYKIALCQMPVTADKEENKSAASVFVGEAANKGADIICLPEIWNSPYDMKLLGGYAEPENGPSVAFMSELAGTYGVYLVGGSIPEISEAHENKDKKTHIYNTSFVFDRTGAIIAKHRKVHLFDIDIKNGIRFKESDFFSAGENITIFDTEFGKIGVAICFDVRFPEMFRTMAKEGAHLVLLPASFNMTTGPAHWDLLIKSRALDNQIFMAACASARNPDASYTSWGHSCVATPWGEYSAVTDAKESIVFATIDKNYMNRIRMEIPVGN